LSQLHQLRGRVGRSSSQAFAFLFIPKSKKTNPQALARLKSIQRYSALGSGYQIALRDLELRGSGSLFGYSQSGKSYVGFELYSKMLGMAMKKIKNKNTNSVVAEVVLDSAHIPLSFIPNDGERSFYYKSISDQSSLVSLESLLNKTQSLFGPLPDSFLSLFKSKKLSLLSENTPVVKVLYNNKKYLVFFTLDGIRNLSSFLSLLDVFFVNHNLSYVITTDDLFLKIQFEYIKDDYYILLENFITYLHV